MRYGAKKKKQCTKKKQKKTRIKTDELGKSLKRNNIITHANTRTYLHIVTTTSTYKHDV